MEKTAVKPPWKSLRDSHFPHSPGDGAFHFTKNTSSAEPAIYPQISLSKLKFKWSKIARGLLSVSKRKVELMEAELKAPGRE
jgi:hypothetical protein